MKHLQLMFAPRNQPSLSIPPHYLTFDYTMCPKGYKYPSFLRKRRNSLLDYLVDGGSPEGQNGAEMQITTATKEPLNKKQKRARKIVRMVERPVICTYEYTDDDIQNAWYTRAEYDVFVDECRTLIMAVTSVGSGEFLRETLTTSNDTCTRGLEDQIIPQLNRLKKQRKRGLIQMVLRQQEIQKLIGCFDVERIRSISILFSNPSREWATKLASHDDAFVRKWRRM
mmetsp:Transcript_24955/g.40842  ORF Transcript_24955/g.40842 Transcript_24955/m.40842 type:complete len:226 (-) Transcript_24955:150-827(-)